jgi:predicted nucleic acid-binding protein
MNVVDSSGWLEYFAGGLNAEFFAPAIEDVDDLVVPTISIYEVFKRVLQQTGESEALRAVGFMHLGEVVDLTSTIAIHAAKLSAELKIPMADSIMLASSQEQGATLWTQDADLRGLEGVEFTPKA